MGGVGVAGGVAGVAELGEGVGFVVAVADVAVEVEGVLVAVGGLGVVVEVVGIMRNSSLVTGVPAGTPRRREMISGVAARDAVVSLGW